MKKERNLNRKERAEIARLVKQECANYNKTYDCCPLLDDYGCYMLTVRTSGNGLCKYFRDAVLPLNPALQAVFIGGKTKPCKQCGREFVPSGRQAYCSDACALEGRRAATAKRTRKYRENKG